MIPKDTGDGGAGSKLLGKFDQMIDLMADCAIEEMPRGEFAETDAEAYQRARDIEATQPADRTKVTGGYEIKVTSTVEGTQNQYWYVLTRDAPEWSSYQELYTNELASVRKCLKDLEPWRHDPPINQTQWVYSALYQSGFLTGDDLTDLKKHHSEVTKSFGDDLPVWDNIGQMKDDVSSWDGHFIKALTDIYLSRMKHILLGQMAVTGYLLGSLQMSQAAVEQAETDIGNVLDKVIAALEESLGGDAIDITVSEALNVVAKGTAVLAGVAALVPGGQLIAGVLGLSSVVAEIGSELTSKNDSKVATNVKKGQDAQATHMRISGGTVSDLARSFRGEITQCLNQVAAVENGAADMLSDLSGIVARNEVVTDDISSIHVPLTSRDAYFRPKPVTGGSGSQSLPGESGTKNLAVADVDVLATMGAGSFPKMADEYRSMNDDLTSIEESFLSQALIRTTIGESSRLHGKWTHLQGQLSTLFTQSATNLDDVGAVIVDTALAIEDTDKAAGTSIDESTHKLIDKES